MAVESKTLRESEWKFLRSEISSKQEFCERIKIGIVASVLAIYAFAIENRSWANGSVHALIVFGGLPLLIASLGYYWVLTHRFSVVRIALYLRECVKGRAGGLNTPTDWEDFLRTDKRLVKANKVEDAPWLIKKSWWLPKTRSDGIICGVLCVFALVASLSVLIHGLTPLDTLPKGVTGQTQAASNPSSGSSGTTGEDAAPMRLHWAALIPFPFALLFIYLHCFRMHWQIRTVNAEPPILETTSVDPTANDDKSAQSRENTDADSPEKEA